MSSVSNAQSMSEGQAERPASTAVQPFAWSVRRELWEHRAIWMAPAIAAGLTLLGFALRMFKLPELMHAAEKLPPVAQGAAIAAPFGIAAGAVMVTGFIVGVFYCLSALNNERRDRSILFWKSLPVSDTTAVLSKAFIPFVVLPVVIFGVVIVTQLIMLLLGSAILMISGTSPAPLWTNWPVLRMTGVLIYFLVIAVLWYAPIHAWLLMVSSWARRVAFLWAVLPWPGLMIVEKIAFDTSYMARFVGYRLNGLIQEGFIVPETLQHTRHVKNMKDLPAVDPLSLIAPGHFLMTPGLWLGLLAAAAMIAAAIWFRRMRDPG